MFKSILDPLWLIIFGTNHTQTIRKSVDNMVLCVSGFVCRGPRECLTLHSNPCLACVDVRVCRCACVQALLSWVTRVYRPAVFLITSMSEVKSLIVSPLP